MRIAIYYFSGTGNTTWVVKKLSEHLIQMNHEINLVCIEQCDTPTLNLDHIDVVGIAFPIHSSFAPSMVKNFLLKLPKVEKIPLFTMSTAGYVVGDVGWFETRELISKGYSPFLFGNVVMGNNMHLPYLSPLPVTTYKKMNQRLIKVERKVKKLAYLIDQKKTFKKGIGPFGRFYGFTQRLFAKTFKKYAFKGFTVDHSSCVKCQLCIKYCPTNNIEIKNDQIKIMSDCMLCMRCYSFCPKQAINCTEQTKRKKYRRYQGPEGKRFKSIY